MAQNRDGSCFPQESDFPARLKHVIGEQSIRSFAAKVGLSASAIHQYLSGKSEPTRGSLIAISEASHTRIEWLVTGRGPMEEMPKTHFSPGVSEPPVSILNSRLLLTVLNTIEEVLGDQVHPISIEKKTQIIVSLYELFQSLPNGTPINRAAVSHLLTLASAPGK